MQKPVGFSSVNLSVNSQAQLQTLKGLGHKSVPLVLHAHRYVSSFLPHGLLDCSGMEALLGQEQCFSVCAAQRQHRVHGCVLKTPVG